MSLSWYDIDRRLARTKGYKSQSILLKKYSDERRDVLLPDENNSPSIIYEQDAAKVYRGRKSASIEL